MIVSALGFSGIRFAPSLELDGLASAFWVGYLLPAVFCACWASLSAYRTEPSAVVGAWLVSLLFSGLFAVIMPFTESIAVYALVMLAAVPPSFLTAWAGMRRLTRPARNARGAQP